MNWRIRPKYEEAWGTRGDLWAVDYTVGDDIKMLSHTLRFKAKDVKSIEGHIISSLAEFHQVPAPQIHVYHTIRLVQ